MLLKSQAYLRVISRSMVLRGQTLLSQCPPSGRAAFSGSASRFWGLRAAVLVLGAAVLGLPVACTESTTGDQHDGDPSFGGMGGGSSVPSPVYTMGGDGPVSWEGVSFDPSWAESVGPKCTTQSQAAPADPEPASTECRYFAPVFPGVFEYSIGDPRKDDHTYFEHTGCDGKAGPCVGRLEYEASVEYVSEVDWKVRLRAKNCDVILSLDFTLKGATEIAEAQSVLRFSQEFASDAIEMHLRPTPSGFSVASIQVPERLALIYFRRSPSWRVYYEHDQTDTSNVAQELQEALLEHLRGQTWQCTHPQQ